MRKLLALTLTLALTLATASGRTVIPRPNELITPAAFNNMYPFMNERMRQELRPDGTAFAPNPTATFARAAVGAGFTPNQNFVPAMAQRQVIPRPNNNANVARAATTQNVGARGNAPDVRAAAQPPLQNQQRQVIARQARGGGNTTPPPAGPVITMTAEQCLAMYTTCMNDFCARPNTPHGSCFCSDRFAQIHANYRTRINNILRSIVIMETGGQQAMTDDEVEAYWGHLFAATNNNSLANLNATLAQINVGADWQNPRQGAQAFMIGHEFCIQYLRNCFFAANNMMATYRNSIARDCAIYEQRMRQTLRVAEQTLLNLGGEL